MADFIIISRKVLADVFDTDPAALSTVESNGVLFDLDTALKTANPVVEEVASHLGHRRAEVPQVTPLAEVVFPVGFFGGSRSGDDVEFDALCPTCGGLPVDHGEIEELRRRLAAIETWAVPALEAAVSRLRGNVDADELAHIERAVAMIRKELEP